MDTLETKLEETKLQTKYGVLEGVVWAERYRDGSVESCALEALNQVKTAYGTFVPQYEEDPRRKQSRPLEMGVMARQERCEAM